jgi:hypothetical protein
MLVCVSQSIDTRLASVTTIEETPSLLTSPEVLLLSNLHIQYRQVTKVQQVLNSGGVVVVVLQDYPHTFGVSIKVTINGTDSLSIFEKHSNRRAGSHCISFGVVYTI